MNRHQKNVRGLDAIHVDFDGGPVGQQDLNNLLTLDKVSVLAKGLMLEFAIWRHVETKQIFKKTTTLSWLIL